MVTSESPDPAKVQECVNVINDPNTSCDVVIAPEKSPACSFLIPPAPAPEVDAATE